jgi:hypothetical protein
MLQGGRSGAVAVKTRIKLILYIKDLFKDFSSSHYIASKYETSGE